jgi:hypothetical protein
MKQAWMKLARMTQHKSRATSFKTFPKGNLVVADTDGLRGSVPRPAATEAGERCCRAVVGEGGSRRRARETGVRSIFVVASAMEVLVVLPQTALRLTINLGETSLVQHVFT